MLPAGALLGNLVGAWGVYRLLLAGYMSDPWELPGLAHFCEHMLFLGTEKVSHSMQGAPRVLTATYLLSLTVSNRERVPQGKCTNEPVTAVEPNSG